MVTNRPQPKRSQGLDEARSRRVPRASKPTSIHVPDRLTALGKGEMAKPPHGEDYQPAKSIRRQRLRWLSGVAEEVPVFAPPKAAHRRARRALARPERRQR